MFDYRKPPGPDRAKRTWRWSYSLYPLWHDLWTLTQESSPFLVREHRPTSNTDSGRDINSPDGKQGVRLHREMFQENLNGSWMEVVHRKTEWNIGLEQLKTITFQKCDCICRKRVRKMVTGKKAISQCDTTQPLTPQCTSTHMCTGPAWTERGLIWAHASSSLRRTVTLARTKWSILIGPTNSNVKQQFTCYWLKHNH